MLRPIQPGGRAGTKYQDCADALQAGDVLGVPPPQAVVDGPMKRA